MSQLPDIEIVAAKVHESWINSKLISHITSRKAEDGEELMVPYCLLSEKAKSLDRNSVIAVYDAMSSFSSNPDGMWGIPLLRSAIQSLKNTICWYAKEKRSGFAERDQKIAAMSEYIKALNDFAFHDERCEPERVPVERLNKLRDKAGL